MTVFFVIGAIGLVLLLVSLVAGELVEGLVDSIGGEWVSGAGLAGFVGSFGFAGALGYSLSSSVVLAVAVGLLAGLVIAFLVALATRYLQRDDDHSTVRTASLVGRAATVGTPVPAEGYGEITLVAAGHRTRLNARAAAPIAQGTRVTITEVLSATAVRVEPVSAVPPAVPESVALDAPVGLDRSPGSSGLRDADEPITPADPAAKPEEDDGPTWSPWPAADR